MKIYHFLIAIMLVFFASCKIKTHVHFNKDNSGTVNITYDLSDLYSDEGGKDSSGVVDSIVESLQKMDTLKILKKYKVVKTDFGIEISYSFDNIEDLNNSFSKFLQGDDVMERAGGKFSVKRNKMSYELTNPRTEEEKSEAEFDGMFDWEFKVSFEKKIKKCSNKNYTVQNFDNSLNIKGTLQSFQDAEKMNFKVKLK